jgi:hypothetical protein
MTDTPGSTPPFPGFPGFPPSEMLDQMWGMMRLTPFGAAFPGTQASATPGLTPSLSMMSDMMAPLTNVEELDKRITDMRAVEQWLKLNLNMLQSAIQALEVQRATLATLRAFGAFAQSSMSQATKSHTPTPAPTPTASSAFRSAQPAPEPKAEEADAAGAAPAFDASGWWNLLQAQFNQIAQFAMTQPGAAAAAESSAPEEDAAQAGAAESPDEAKPSAKESATKRASAARPSSGTPSRPRATKKTPSQPE